MDRAVSSAGHASWPRWHPDGSGLAYLHGPLAGPDQLVFARPWHESASRLTDLPGGLSAPEFSPTGERIGFLHDDPEPLPEGLEWWAPPRRTGIWTVELGSEATQRLSGENIHVWEFCWAPDGSRVAAVVSTEPGESEWFGCRLVAMDGKGVSELLDGARRADGDGGAPETYRQIAAPAWSPDGDAIAFVMGARSDRDIIGGDLNVLSLRDGRLRNLTLGLPLTVTWIQWTSADSVLAAVYDAGKQSLIQVDVTNGEIRSRWREAVSFDRFWPRFSWSATGRIAAARESTNMPREIWVAETRPSPVEWRPVTVANASARARRHPAFREVEWSAGDGRRISGIVVVPRAPHRPEAMVTWVHGGPNFLHQHLYYGAASPWIIAALPELLAARGFHVFLPNPRGSIGWGAEFAEAVIGDMGGADAEDILVGVDHCVQEFGIDPARLGLGGWSYGGFMSAWLVTQTDRFGAAVVGAGTANWRSMHGTSSVGAWDRQYLRDDPYRIGGPYDTRSPVSYAHRSTTPTLLVHGAADGIVPPGQAIEFATALRESGCEAQIRFYPREGHDFVGRRAQVQLADDITDWFDRWLLTKEGAEVTT
jgi:dipeptidyl aminopeptidase/acylaminoacyl peptidase